MFFDIDYNISCPRYTYRYSFWVFADSKNSSVKGCPGIAEQPFTGVCLV